RRILDEYCRQMNREWERLRPFLPARASRILDIGCGIGGMDEFAYRAYCPGGPVELFLVDRNRFEGQVFYGFAKQGAAYNSLELSKKYLTAKGIPQRVLRTINVETSELPMGIQYDLIMSLLSWCFHYPVDVYLKYVKEHLAPDGTLIVDCRRNTD